MKYRNSPLIMLIGLLILTFSGCKEETEIPNPLSGNEQISMKFDGKYAAQDSGSSVIYYNQYLSINSFSITGFRDNFLHYSFEFNGMYDGTLNVNLINELSLTFREIDYTNVRFTNFTPTDGHFIITEFDSINNSVSGEFEMTLENDEHTRKIEIKEGKLQDLPFAEIFCQPNWPVFTHDSTSIYNKWGLVGIRDEDGNMDYPPCDSSPFIIITPPSKNEDYENIQGSNSSNGFWGKASIDEENQTITVGELISTLSFTSLWNSDYDRKFMRILNDATIHYQFSDSKLIITKENSDLELVFVPVE